MRNSWPIEELTVSYSQLVLYQNGIKEPYLEWKGVDLKRGYISQNGILSIEALSNTTCEVRVGVIDEYKMIKESVRSFLLPFEVLEDGVIISSVGQKGLFFDVPKGSYSVHFDAFPLEPSNAEELYRVRYIFQFKRV
ncbi:competence protein ComJ [Priestia endophytica]|uniref:competence protein ComJ n=1 Tax=Priestia endophytica TaxID=135735 RepID=UPI00203F0DDD|nr:competence protein ComJ [Priestia endophytica]MCM3538600.1 competence protein ComJ [Priestia endophytica]